MRQKIICDIELKMDQPTSAQKSDPDWAKKKKKKTRRLVMFTVPEDPKEKESE